ncbi:hypothetical protein [Acaryochloris sp. IP29b_bin.148]|uniref:hypothetical protein n=1 Tax=Acaryochloris sp. IP29b_bin.148 TaxID=2969218 RepID=UPI002607919A|nr:hypothetical protein [Acaryochloris sp. IP29b_bin.148]
MIYNSLKRLAIGAIGVVFSLLMITSPAWATTYSFKSAGNIGDEGVISGKVTYSKDVVLDALNSGKDLEGLAGSLTINDLGKDAKFSFEYISPHTGVKHTEQTICNRNIYDLDNGQEGNYSIGGQDGPFFSFDGGGNLYLVDFKSCVGEEGGLASSISKRDPKIAYSELDVQFSQYKLAEFDYIGNKPPRFIQKNIKIKFERELA